MDHPEKEKNNGKPRILVAPLDWGLGHATRCIPLIRELLLQGAAPILAGEAAQEFLLRSEFPQLSFISLPGYRIKYAKTAPGLTWKMILQASRIKKAINDEQKWLQQKVKEWSIDAVISDNRYGLYHDKIPSVFITHQLNIKTPWGKWADNILQKRNYRYIERFQSCWIPDHRDEPSLGGELSHPGKIPQVPIEYIGPLSRFEKINTDTTSEELLIILSGPEPQRSILENKIIRDVAHYNGIATIVRGLPGHASFIPSSNMIRFYNHLPASELQSLIPKAGFIISRSGYSTIMDMLPLRKKCIFIPTPGQTEQNYLGKHLANKKLALTFSQENFSLTSALEKASQFNYTFDELPKADDQLMKIAVQKLLAMA